MKHTTLSLLVVILKRAQNTAGFLASLSSSSSSSSLSSSLSSLPHHTNAVPQSAEASLLLQFREEVIKALPDVTTIISLRQNLVSGKAKAESQEEGTCVHVYVWSNKNQDSLNVIIHVYSTKIKMKYFLLFKGQKSLN